MVQAPIKDLTTKYRMTVSTKPVITVPHSESNGFFIFPSSRYETAASVEAADWHRNSHAS